MNKTVLITGASSGIGFELARIFAGKGYTVVMTAHDRVKLARAVTSVEKEFSSKIVFIARDLSINGSAEKLFRDIIRKKIDVDILINNAGFGMTGPFLDTDIRKDFAMIELNITSLTVLSKLFARAMKERGGGTILNVASMGSYMPGPFIAEYYATKAYVLSFTEALARELKGTGILVSALCPGATKTEFAKRAGRRDAKHAMTAEKTAMSAYRGLMSGKKIIIPGILNKAGIFFLKVFPRSVVSLIAEKRQRTLQSD